MIYFAGKLAASVRRIAFGSSMPDSFQPVLLGIRVSETSDPERYTAINLHFEGSDWKLAGLELPKAIVRSLAAALPVK